MTVGIDTPVDRTEICMNLTIEEDVAATMVIPVTTAMTVGTTTTVVDNGRESERAHIFMWALSLF